MYFRLRVIPDFSVKILEICLRLNIRCVTVYAFAINNFQRAPREVEALMDLAESKLLELTQQGCANQWSILRRYTENGVLVNCLINTASDSMCLGKRSSFLNECGRPWRGQRK